MGTERCEETSPARAKTQPDDQRARWSHQLAECAREIERAHSELAAAVAALRENMGRVREAIMDSAGRMPPAQPPTIAAVEALPEGAAVFRSEGEYWTVAYDGCVLRLKDTKGMRYIAYLLRHPRHAWRVLDLVATVQHGNHLAAAGPAGGAGNVGPMADARALAEVRQRWHEVQEDLEEAEGRNDVGRIALLRVDAERLAEYLNSCSGFGGRARSLPNAAERARQAVTKAIRNAIKRIGNPQPALAHYLLRHITTGYLCSYEPDPHHPIVWLF